MVTSADSDSVVISIGCASDGWSETVEGSRALGSCFGFSRVVSSFLSSGLVQPHFDVSLPMLSEMDVGNHVVMFDHS